MSTVFFYYEVGTNSDLTEGKGSRVVRFRVTDEDLADRLVRDKQKLTGIMGTDSGKFIDAVTMTVEDGYVTFDKKEVWGYRPQTKSYGWLDERDLPFNDPEWGEYVRLREKFSGATEDGI